MRQSLKKTSYYLVAAVVGMIFVIPLYMVFINSLKTRKEAGLFSIHLPTEWMFENYTTVFESANILRAFINGIIISAGSGMIILAVASLASFVIARSGRRWSNVLYYVFLTGLVIPVAFIPTYLVLNIFNLLNTYTGLILVSATYGLPMSIFLYTGFVKTIPRELDEAAIVDGCSPIRLFFQIIFPLMKPITVTLIILNFIGSWNDVQIPLYFSGSDKWALPLTVYNFYGAHASSWNLIFADIILTILPLFILYLFAQKYIISGMTAGAVKS